jgi:hypothetical protein
MILNFQLQIGDLPTFKSHVRGLVQMVEHNGGPKTLGSNGFLEHLVGKFVGEVETAGPVHPRELCF